MKFYSIERTIKFEFADNRLTNTSSQESVEVSLLASRLLQLLISRQGQVVTRDIIFSELFDKLGASSTNNNLNQYILNLRKDLKFLQLEDEVIQTVPRIGFMIPETVGITEEEYPVELSNNNDNLLVNHVLEARSLFSKKTKLHLLYNSMVIILLIVWGGVHIYRENQSFNWDRLPKTNLQKITNDTPCGFFLLPTDRSFGNADVNYYFSLIDKVENINCPQGGKVNFYFSESFINPHNHRLFILRCPDKVEASAGCFSFYKREEV